LTIEANILVANVSLWGQGLNLLSATYCVPWGMLPNFPVSWLLNLQNESNSKIYLMVSFWGFS
jgi:hypothetical protein